MLLPPGYFEVVLLELLLVVAGLRLGLQELLEGEGEDGCGGKVDLTEDALGDGGQLGVMVAMGSGGPFAQR